MATNANWYPLGAQRDDDAESETAAATAPGYSTPVGQSRGGVGSSGSGSRSQPLRLTCQQELQRAVGELCAALHNFEEAHGGVGGLLISERQASSSVAHEVLAARLADFFLSSSSPI